MSDLKIDTTITGFKFATHFQETKVFTKNGPPDIATINPTAFSFTIAPKVTAEIVKAQFEQFLQLSNQNGYQTNNIVKKDTTLQGHEAFEISYTETLSEENYKNFVFNGYVIKNGTLIIFTSGDLNKGMYTEKFRRTFHSIKL